MTGSKEIRSGLRGALAIAVLAAAFIVPAQANRQIHAQTRVRIQRQPSTARPGVHTGADQLRFNTPTSTFSPAAARLAAGSGGSLPFTGLDVAALWLVAAVLTGTGLALWRLTNSCGQKA